MTVRKVNLYALCVYALLPALMLCSFIKIEADWGMFFGTLLTLLIAWGVGIFLGIGLAVIVKRPRVEPYLYMASQVAVIVTIVVFVVVTRQNDRKHDREIANVRDNHFFVNLDRAMYEAESRECVRTAFL